MRFGWLLVLAACSGGTDKDDEDGELDDSSFSDAYLEAGCDAAVDCNADPLIIQAYCEPETVSSTDSDCAFDEGYAADCLDGEWTCDVVSGITVVTQPSVCGLVFDCSSTSGDDDDDDTTTSGDDDDDDTEPLMAIDDALLGAAVGCSGPSVTFAVGFLGDASYGTFDAADTENWDTAYGNWNDTHTLDAVNALPDGSYTDLESPPISTGATLSSWADGTGTVFRCEYHYNNPGAMTYAARAYDLDNALADCVAWGDDPQGFIDDRNPAGDSYTVYNVRPREGDFAGCRAVTVAR